MGANKRWLTFSSMFSHHSKSSCSSSSLEYFLWWAALRGLRTDLPMCLGKERVFCRRLDAEGDRCRSSVSKKALFSDCSKSSGEELNWKDFQSLSTTILTFVPGWYVTNRRASLWRILRRREKSSLFMLRNNSKNWWLLMKMLLPKTKKE